MNWWVYGIGIWYLSQLVNSLLICKCRPSRLQNSSHHFFQIAKTARTILKIQRSMWSQIDPVWWNKAFVKSPWKSDVLYNYWEFRTIIHSAATKDWRWRCPEDIQIFIILLRSEIVSSYILYNFCFNHYIYTITNDQMTSKASMPQGFEAFGRTRGEADKVPLGSWVGVFRSCDGGDDQCFFRCW